MQVESGDNDSEQGTVDQYSNNKTERPCVIAQAHNPSIYEGDTGGFAEVWGQSRPHSEL